MKFKTLPSLREKKRYIIFEVISEEKVKYNNLRDALWNSFLNILGEKELAEADVRIIKNLFKDSTGFIRCNTKFVDSLKLAMALIHQIGDSKVILKTIRVSGTIKSGKKKLT